MYRALCMHTCIVMCIVSLLWDGRVGIKLVRESQYVRTTSCYSVVYCTVWVELDVTSHLVVILKL